MPPSILAAGLDGRSLPIEAPVLQREGHLVEEHGSGRALLDELARNGGRLVVLGPLLPDVEIADLVQRIRASHLTRRVSILVIVPAGHPESVDGAVLAAGANAVLRRPVPQARLESWIAKLLTVPRRVEARVPVHGHVVGTAKGASASHFLGLARNLSIHGMLLASPVRFEARAEPDLDLEFTLPSVVRPLTALGRVVREAAEVAWPYVGYGVEFLFVPPECLDTLCLVVSQQLAPGQVAERELGIHSTFRRDVWIYEIRKPVRYDLTWQVEIRRAPLDVWRPGAAGPFYVVEGGSAAEALAQARDFLTRHG